MIRPEAADHIPSVRAVVAAAFGREDEADLVDRLRAECADALSLVAVESDAVTGHVMFTPVRIGVVPGSALAPLAVHPSRQRRGVGRALVEAGLAAVRETGVAFVAVLGDPAYYGRFGFAPAAPSGILCPFPGVPAPAWQAIVLDPPALDGVRGPVRYARAFGAPEGG